MDVRDMLRYNDELAASWWGGLEKVDPAVLAKPVDFSFLTPLGILTHMANVEQAWMDVVEGASPKWARHSTKTWDTLAPVRAYALEARTRTHDLVDKLDADGLGRVCAPVDGPFKRPALTVEEILFTVCTHEHIHRGEVLAALWHQGVAPPPADYPAYLTPLTPSTTSTPPIRP